MGRYRTSFCSSLFSMVPSSNEYTAKNLIPIRGRKRARYGTELQHRYWKYSIYDYSIGTFSLGSPIVFFVWGLPYSSNRHVTPVSARGRKGLTCSIRAPPCPRFDTLRQSVSNRAQLFLAVYRTVVHTPKQFYHGTRLKRCKVRQPVGHIALPHA